MFVTLCIRIVLWVSFKIFLYFISTMECRCQFRSKQPFHSYVKCEASVCNRPECATSMLPSTGGYSQFPTRMPFGKFNCYISKTKRRLLSLLCLQILRSQVATTDN